MTQADTKNISPGPLVRLLIILAVRAKRTKYLRWLWKSSSDSPTIVFFKDYVVKTSPFENLAEAHAMQLVARHTTVPVPKVHYAFLHAGRTFIVMGRIDGEMAGRAWCNRPLESRVRILDQLRRMIAEIRSRIPRPAGAVIGDVDGGPFYDCRLPSELFWGPYATAREFHEALIGGINVNCDYSLLPPDVAELFAFYRDWPKADDELVFTHGDLSSLNILVRGDEVVGIVDWETAGWFPAYWEYTCAKFVNPQNPFWEEEVDRFMEPLPLEMRMDEIRRKYFGAFI